MLGLEYFPKESLYSTTEIASATISGQIPEARPETGEGSKHEANLSWLGYPFDLHSFVEE